jgi:hypothetical protein
LMTNRVVLAVVVDWWQSDANALEHCQTSQLLERQHLCFSSFRPPTIAARPCSQIRFGRPAHGRACLLFPPHALSSTLLQLLKSCCGHGAHWDPSCLSDLLGAIVDEISYGSLSAERAFLRGGNSLTCRVHVMAWRGGEEVRAFVGERVRQPSKFVMVQTNGKHNTKFCPSVRRLHGITALAGQWPRHSHGSHTDD